MCVLGHTLFGLSFLIWGPCSLVYPSIGPYAGGILTSVAILVIFPALRTAVSQRVTENDQSKCQAAVATIGTVGAVLSGPLYNHVLFDATSTGLKRALPSLVSMLIACFCVALSFLIAWLVRREG